MSKPSHPTPNAGTLEDQTSRRPWRAKTSHHNPDALDIIDADGKHVALVMTIEDTALILRTINGGDNA